MCTWSSGAVAPTSNARRPLGVFCIRFCQNLLSGDAFPMEWIARPASFICWSGLFLAVAEAEVSQLLDMAAGAVGEVDFSMDVDRMGLGQDAGEETGVDWLDADGAVTVDAALLQELRQEVLTRVARAGRGSLKCVGGMYRCPACRFRAFRDCSRVAQHLRCYHTEKQRFCCSGTKQLRALLSIHDTDMLAESRGGRYLERSEKVIRELVKPELPIKNNNIDRGF